MEEYKYKCEWNPKKDITTYELAQCIPYLFSQIHEIDKWDKLDESITKHFNVSNFHYGKMIRENAEKMKSLLR